MRVDVARHGIVRSVSRPYGNDLARDAAFLTSRYERVPQLVQVVRRHEPFHRLRERVRAHRAQLVNLDLWKMPCKHGRDRDKPLPFPIPFSYLGADDADESVFDLGGREFAPPYSRIEQEQQCVAHFGGTSAFAYFLQKLSLLRKRERRPVVFFVLRRL